MKTHITNEILFVSSFPPRECGIATYTQDLINAISDKFHRSFSIKVCALENKIQNNDYPEEVKHVLDTSNHQDYIKIAEKINNDEQIKVVFIQHEFGLFAGEYGENILYFIYSLHKPIVITFHTVLPEPDERRKHLVRTIIAASSYVVVMTENSKKILVNEYIVAESKISVIHHGTHLVSSQDKTSLKTLLDLNDKFIFSTFGLLSSGKSIETALDAMPFVIKRYPNAHYLVMGKTHPEIVLNEGEIYREFLETKTRTLGIEDNVTFINSYLSLESLLEYLQLTDVYLFTSKDPNQAVSGTFSYAMGCSCPIISTPIPHAKEMLKDNAGMIVDFQNSEQLSASMIEMISNPKKRREMSANALKVIRPSAWQNSAIAHSEILSEVIDENIDLIYNIPKISMNQIKRLTTQTGMIQFSRICRPDVSSGYTLDDNSRALIAVTKHFTLTKELDDIPLIDTYLNFIQAAQLPDGGFLNYIDDLGNFHDQNENVNLEDSTGRAIWALGEFISHGHLFNLKFTEIADEIFKKSLRKISKLQSPRAIAFAIKGMYFYNLQKNSYKIKCLIEKLADNLVLKYYYTNEAEWKWFEDSLTYANSVLPESLLYAYLSTQNNRYKYIAKASFDFLLSMIITNKNIKVISNQGWHIKGNVPNYYGEQPIDVAYTILALDLFYEVFDKNEYLKNLETAFSWFHGNNHLKQIVYNPSTGGCQDGLEEYNINLNQGAESTVCYLLARLTMEKYIDKKQNHAPIYFSGTSEYSNVKIKSILNIISNG